MDKKLIERGADFECPHCHAQIKDEIFYMTDKPIKYCPCCGEEIKQ